MKKIDYRHNYILFIDTETANTFRVGKNLDIDSGLFYDLGLRVQDTKNRVYDEMSFINSDVYYDEAELIKSAYYADKMSRYDADIEAGSRKVATTLEIREIIHELIERYHINYVCAHNARFDKSILDSTIRYITKSEIRYFLPYGVEWWDTMKMARSVIHKMPTYRRFCEENNYITKNGGLSTTAENLFRFISKNPDFEESHTGLEDVQIESEIFHYCQKQHRKIERNLYKENRLVELSEFDIQLRHNMKIFPTI